MRLPNAHRTKVERGKIANYLLSLTNPRGKSKAEFFLDFGFNSNNWEGLAGALKVQGASNEVVRIVETAYGPRYSVDGMIETLDGRNPQIKTVWQFDTGTDYPRLITARPLRDRRRSGVLRT